MARVIPSAASSADAATRTLAGFTSRLGKRCSISLAMCSMASLPIRLVLSVRPVRGSIRPRRRSAPGRRAGLLVLRKPRLAFDRDAEVVERGIQLEFHLRVVVEAGLPALPDGVHYLVVLCALQHQTRQADSLARRSAEH